MKMLPRIIPVLLLHKEGLYKTVKFSAPKYVGDPINAVKVFNDKEVDELVFLDIDATKENREPNYDLLKQIASECFMPLCYGGGIKNIEQIRKILKLGFEKVAINSEAVRNPEFIKQSSQVFGSSTIVVSIDYKSTFLSGKYPFAENGKMKAKTNLLNFVKLVEEMGAGEILLNCIENDGLMQGYDLQTIDLVSKSVSIPVIACGGAGKLTDFSQAIQHQASAAAAGSMFVFYGPHRAVLISYPDTHELKQLFENY